jgi:hypothetical protein
MKKKSIQVKNSSENKAQKLTKDELAFVIGGGGQVGTISLGGSNTNAKAGGQVNGGVVANSGN